MIHTATDVIWRVVGPDGSVGTADTGIPFKNPRSVLEREGT